MNPARYTLREREGGSWEVLDTTTGLVSGTGTTEAAAVNVKRMLDQLQDYKPVERDDTLEMLEEGAVLIESEETCPGCGVDLTKHDHSRRCEISEEVQ